MGDAYRRVNPQCTVPALQTGEGPLLTDNAAIAAWLEARFPEPPLMGRTPAEKAEIASWNWRIEFDGLMAIAEALRNSAPSMANRALPGPVDYAQIPALAERGRARVQQFFDMLNKHLAASPTSARWWRSTSPAWCASSRAMSIRTCNAGGSRWGSGRRCRSSGRSAACVAPRRRPGSRTVSSPPWPGRRRRPCRARHAPSCRRNP